MTPRVSVLLPVRNGEAHLEESIRSIEAQTFADWELLVIDDGSTDATPQVAARRGDPRIRCVRREPRGLPHALNAGLELARGEYVARQDADDLSFPERLADQVAYLDSHPEAHLLGCGFRTIDGGGRVIGAYSFAGAHEALAAQMAQLVNPLPHTGVVFRRSAALAVGGYRELFRKAQDYDFYLRLGDRHRLAGLEQPLCSVRLAMSSMTSDPAGGAQFRFSVLALACALLRRRGGRDPLDGAGREDFIARFDRWYAASAYPRVFRSRERRKEAHLAWARGGRARAIGCLLRAAVEDPPWLLERLHLGRAPLAAELERWAADQLAEERRLCAA